MIAFDLDGVLIDSAERYGEVMQAALCSVGLALTAEVVRARRVAHVGQWLEALIPLDLVGRAEVREGLTAQVRAVMAAAPAEMAAAPAAEAALAELAAHHELCVVTNSCGAYARAVLEHHRLARFLRRIVSADDGFAGKDAALRELAASLQIARGRFYYVGDTARDVEDAHAGGGLAVIVYAPISWDFGRLDDILASRPDIIADSLEELATDLSRRARCA
ncbi:MAG: HAD family hydrolase [Candidatus Schekmanbacteria bacterium]|nr:HAD family hydrolase [Candidatus Schekmanbacteria bacterium]